MRPKVILYNNIADDLVKRLEADCNLYQAQKGSSEFVSLLSEAEGIIGSGLNIDKELLDKAPNIRIVSNISAGYDNLDIKELTKRNVLATNTPNVLTNTTADAIFGLMLATARRVPELDAYVKSGAWKSSINENQFGLDVHHKTLGIIGMGRIGKAVAERAHYGFKMNILYHNRSRDLQAEKELNANYMTMSNLLKNSDFVCLLAPLSSETINLITKREFNLMKNTAIFINGSRGLLVVEEDLIEAINNRDIWGAGLDVYREEPIGDSNPLINMENIVTLPHIGSATKETRYKMEELAVENLLQGLNGDKPSSLINREVKVNNNHRTE